MSTPLHPLAIVTRVYITRNLVSLSKSQVRRKKICRKDIYGSRNHSTPNNWRSHVQRVNFSSFKITLNIMKRILDSYKLKNLWKIIGFGLGASFNVITFRCFYLNFHFLCTIQSIYLGEFHKYNIWIFSHLDTRT